jgi:hypothetical protein
VELGVEASLACLGLQALIIDYRMMLARCLACRFDPLQVEMIEKRKSVVLVRTLGLAGVEMY